MSDVEQLSPRWKHAVIATFILGFAVLILLTFKAYQNAPPIPARVLDASGAVVFTGDVPASPTTAPIPARSTAWIYRDSSQAICYAPGICSRQSSGSPPRTLPVHCSWQSC